MKNTMIKIGLAFMGIVMFNLSFAQDITLDKEVHDYGTIAKGDNGSCTFTITNSGDQALIISDCKSTTPLITTEFSSEEIAPGASTQITITYDTTKRIGPINKSIAISSNAISSPTKVIRIKGMVK